MFAVGNGFPGRARPAGNSRRGLDAQVGLKLKNTSRVRGVRDAGRHYGRVDGGGNADAIVGPLKGGRRTLAAGRKERGFFVWSLHDAAGLIDEALRRK